MDAPLRAEVDGSGAVRIQWVHHDWLGALRFEGGGQAEAITGEDRLGLYAGHAFASGPVSGSVRAYADRPLAVLRIEARATVDDLATGDFVVPSRSWSIAPDERAADGLPEDAVGFGFQYTEFAMPTITDASLQGWFLFPARPALVLPMMVVAPDGRTLLLAPLDNFHEQILAVDGGLRWGWHGDLERADAGFATELALWGGSSPRRCLDEWAAELRSRHATVRPGRYADDLNRKPSYWTDNGAAYWYKTEPGHDVPGTLVAAIDDLRSRQVPFSTFQLDSWFYSHAVVRPFDTDEWLVPPAGLVEWDARPDILPDGVAALSERLGNPPLTVHCRHLSAESPYVDQFPCWIDGERAHPKGPELYERWLDQAVQWGATTFEHDWLIECFLRVRGLRAEAGRARAWQEGVDVAAGERGITLQWCMPSPADLCQTVTLSNVASVRTSGDHGYLVSPGYLWGWFLYTNALARALGLRPFKDVFHADRDDPNAHADVEALLSALSTGPVGVGDRIGRSDPEVLRPTCRGDGMLVKPDTPVAALDRSFRRWATRRHSLLIGSATTRHAAGLWSYVVTLNASEAPAQGQVLLADLGDDAPDGPVAVWDWRKQLLAVLQPDEGWDVDLEPLDWDYRVVAPIVGDVAVIGDPQLYASAGDLRVAEVSEADGGLRVTLLGVDEDVELVAWTASGGVQRQTVTIPRTGWVHIDLSRGLASSPD